MFKGLHIIGDDVNSFFLGRHGLNWLSEGMKESFRRLVVVSSYIFLTVIWLFYRFSVKSIRHNEITDYGGLQVGEPFYTNSLTMIVRGYWQGYVSLIVLIVCLLIAHKLINWIFQHKSSD